MPRDAAAHDDELVLRRRWSGSDDDSDASEYDRPRGPSPCGGSYVECIDGERPDEWLEDNWDEWLSSTQKRGADRDLATPEAKRRSSSVVLPTFVQTPPSLAEPMVNRSARPPARLTVRPTARLTVRPTARRLSPLTNQWTALRPPPAPELLPGAVLWIDMATRWVGIPPPTQCLK